MSSGRSRRAVLHYEWKPECRCSGAAFGPCLRREGDGLGEERPIVIRQPAQLGPDWYVSTCGLARMDQAAAESAKMDQCASSTTSGRSEMAVALTPGMSTG